MRLDEINALRELDRGELIAKALELGVRLNPDVAAQSFPTGDALRLAIIEKTIEKEAPTNTASKVGSEHFAEAVLVHAHAVELGREAEALADDEGSFHRSEVVAARARRHFEVARSASAVAQVGLIAAALDAIGEILTGMGQD